MSKSTKQLAETYFDDIFSAQPSENESGTLLLLSHEEIKTGPQPRTVFDIESLNELSSSIRDLAAQGRGVAGTGILQPLLAYSSGNEGVYTLIAGERRFRASQMAGIKKIPVLLVAIPDTIESASVSGNSNPVNTQRQNQELSTSDDSTEARNYFFLEQLIENLQRDDLSPIEEAHAFEQLSLQKNLSQRDLAQLLGKSRGYITNRLALLKFKPDVQNMVVSRETTLKHAPILDAIDDGEKRRSLIEDVLAGELSVRALELHVAQQHKKINSQPERQLRDERFENQSRTSSDNKSAKTIQAEDLQPALSMIEGAHQKYQSLSTSEKKKLKNMLQKLQLALDKFDL